MDTEQQDEKLCGRDNYLNVLQIKIFTLRLSPDADVGRILQ